jgi:hypothetical protein
MNRLLALTLAACVVVAGLAVFAPRALRKVSASDSGETREAANHITEIHALEMIARGRNTFRFDTFGDQNFWGGSLQLHKAIEGQKLAGVGPGVDPATALAVGLKVDVDALPASVIQALKAGKVNLKDPATTVALLKLNSVVGVKGFFDNSGKLKSVGSNALCVIPP